MINCYAFRSVPPFAQGLVRDLRVRWGQERCHDDRESDDDWLRHGTLDKADLE